MEYHAAEVTFLEKQEAKIFSQMVVPDPDGVIQDKASEQENHRFSVALLKLIKDTDIS